MSPAAKADPIEPTLEEIASTSHVYQQFVTRFGEDNAQRIIDCGLHHRTRPRQGDLFADCFVIAIAYECMTVYREAHGFTMSDEDTSVWAEQHINYESYEELGDVMDVFKARFKAFRRL